MKNVIAYSLWGEKPIYWRGAIKNIELTEKFFPGWICRFYIDKNCKEDLIRSLKGENVETILVEKNYEFDGMFWRFKASYDPEVNIFLSRDTDSRFSEREVFAIQEWLKSDKDFHIIRDHPYHSVPILGGLWGCRNGLMEKINLKDKLEKWKLMNKKGDDQIFLEQEIYPLIYQNCLEHATYFCYKNSIHPLPPRNNHEFIGDVFDENNQRDPEFYKMLLR